MGKVYSAEDIGRGNIPEPGAHGRAIKRVTEIIGRKRDARGDGVGGMPFGSVVLGTSDDPSRSDVDYLIRWHASDDPLLHVAWAAVENVFAEEHVPFNLLYFDDKAVCRSLGAAGNWNFVESLRLAAKRGPVVGQPLKGLRGFDDYPTSRRIRIANDLAQRYASECHTHFYRILDELGGIKPEQDLEDALELPSSLGRFMLAATCRDTNPAQDEQFYRRSRLTQAMRQVNTNPAWVDTIGVLQDMNSSYSAILEEATARRRSLKSYERWIYENAEPAVERAYFVTSLARKLIAEQATETHAYSEIGG